MARVLIVDDDKGICGVIEKLVREMGHRAVATNSIGAGTAELGNGPFDVVLLDVRLPDGSGLTMIPEIRHSNNRPEVIIMTGYGDPEGAELAIKNGAWDYFQKPVSPKDLMLHLTRVFQHRESLKAFTPRTASLQRTGIVGDSAYMTRIGEDIGRAAECDTNVLITGETGTGKELLARAVHQNSTRAHQRFVVVDCAALPENLVESVLFGHVRGAFTGADTSREGLVKQADAGTLFLDEVGELPPGVQKRFLRVLQERRFRPVGGRREISSDFRLVAATNRDLDAMVAEGRFRADLLYRIRALHVAHRPLREHPGDIEAITRYHLDRFCSQRNLERKTLSPEFIQAMEAYDWPGNVRELVNAVEVALLNARQVPMLFPVHLPLDIRICAARSAVTGDVDPQPVEPKTAESVEAFRDHMKRHEKAYLTRLMTSVSGDISDACRTSGLSRSRMYSLLKEHAVMRN